MVKKQYSHCAPPQQSREASDQRAGQRKPERERHSQTREHPQQEGAVDETHDGVRQQVLRVALLAGHLLASEDPPHVCMEEAAKRAAPAAAVIDMRAVRVS